MTTVNDFINFFEPIPEDKWCIYQLENNAGQRCAMGHVLGGGISRLNDDTRKLTHGLFKIARNIIDVNNGVNRLYQQETPKQRVLSALYDIRDQQNAVNQAVEIIKEDKLELVC